MSAVDDVIARSRQPGGFVARKRFAVARSRAVQKLRRFALASPHDYIIELIQAAIANGADFVDIELGHSGINLSYAGGGFAPEELAQLFDFLFASKENLETADVRQLALGLNALLDARPDEIVIESGDGTLARTTRVRIDGRSEAVEVGSPRYALRGTFVRVAGLKRGPLGDGSRQGELLAIEGRCLTAPVPIVVNSQPIFGYGRMRTPRLLGYDAVLSFDEGDLYGTIGLGGTAGDSFFRLLTWGVWIDSLRADILPGTSLGGIVGFDRLHKTADHAAVVQDERLGELWTRLRPYARMLAEGRRGAATHELWSVDGRPLRTSDIRATFKQYRTVVGVSRGEPGDRPERARRAAAIGAALQAPVVLLGADDAAALRLLGGPDTRLVLPDVSDDDDLWFYHRFADGPPDRPWLVAPIEVEPLPVQRLLELAERDGILPPDAAQEIPAFGGLPPWNATARDLKRWLLAAGAAGDVRATIYSPEHVAPGVELWVDTVVTGRRIVAGNMPSPFPGFVLRVELPDVSPRGWTRPWPGRHDATPAGIIAAALARHVVPVLETAARRLLAGLGRLPVEPGSAAARIALAALARSTIKRLRTAPDGSVEVRFSILDPELPDTLLDLPLLRTLAGEGLSLRALARMVDASAGVAYGAVREVPPDLEGLDRSRILDLDLHQERMLIGLLGEAAYVRVDRRDVLAEAAGVRCRDFALGLRPYPDFPLLVEGIDPGTLPALRRREVERALVERLVAVFHGARGEEESRRQATRHLLWFLYRKLAHRAGGPDDCGVSHLPLFLDADGVPRTFDELRPALASAVGLRMHDGWSTDVANLPPPTPTSHQPPATSPTSPSPPPLAMNPFVFRLLSQLGRVRPAFDFDLSDAEALADPAPPETAYAAAVTIDDELAVGTIGVPVLEPPDPAIAVLDPRGRRVAAVRASAGEAGVVGRLEVKVPSIPPDVLGMLVDRAIASLLDELVRRIPALPPDSPVRERCVSAALRLAGRRVALTAQPDGSVALDVLDASARRALELPLFPTPDGIAVSAWRILREFAASRSGTAAPGPGFVLAPDAPDILRSWIAATCCDARIARPASRPAAVASPEAVPVPQGVGGPKDADHRALLGGKAAESLRGQGAAPPDPTPLAVSAPDTGPDGGDFGRRLTEALRRVHEESAAPGPPIEVAVWNVAAVPAQAAIAQGRTIFLQATSDGPRLILDTKHWLLARARTRGPADPEALAWLLLAASTHLNVALESITNRNELDFQARLLDLLERGALVPGRRP
ncbi:MAG: hypothetical protein HY907_06875 [Deltaproteobacteria bacterium]|nr:hypothetical protein [Deltaproteobacteria bacterium]